MNKTLICIIIFLVLAFSGIALAQNTTKAAQGQELIDSLILVLSKSNEDINKANLYYELSLIYTKINPNEGLIYANKGILLSERINEDSEKFYRTLGNNYLAKSDYPEALSNYFTALKINEKNNNIQGIAASLLDIGVVYINQSDNDKALTYLFKSLKIYTDLDNKREIASNLNNIGNVYLQKGEYSKSISYYNKALKINTDLGFADWEANNLGNLGNVYYFLSNYNQALKFYLKALNIYKLLNDKDGIAINFNNIGGAYLLIGTDTTNNNKKKALNFAKIYTDSAIVIEKEISSYQYLLESYNQLSEIQKQQNNYKEAFHSFTLYKLYSDSVFNMEKDKKLTQTGMQYEFDKKEAETKAEQEKKDIRQHLIIYSILAGMLSMLVFSIVVYRQRNKVKKEKARSESLLLNILPADVAEELKQKGFAAAKQYNNVTVLFTDFVNFTGISEQLSPTELVAEIHKNFTAFDIIMENHGLEKIKTIGDAYLAVCGLPNPVPDHAQRVVNAAIAINEYMQTNNGKFKIRVGINTGSVVAGIVGVKKYAYDIWGDTVNTAARMEQNSAAGKINISGSTYQLIKDSFTCEYRGKINAKNKGEVDMYFVNS